MTRYPTPEKGTTNWHVPLEGNFADLDTEVLNEVATFGDLPAPTGETSSNGIPRRYLVRDEQTVYRDAGDGWNAVLTSGGSGTAPTGDIFVEGTTVADINRALQNQHCVWLKPGQTYTNGGNDTIEFPGGENKTVLAYGAEIEVRSNPTVLMQEGGVGGNENGWSRWHGGVFRGSSSGGEVAFQAVDNIFGVIDPHVIQDCEVGVALTNDDHWCEFMTVDYWGVKNEIGTLMIGGDGTPPDGCSVTRPNGGADDSPSFRHLYLRAYDQLPTSNGSGMDGCYGIYMEEASPYTGTIDYTVSLGPGDVGWRYHGRMNGNNIKYHAEAPAGHDSGGIGFKVDKNRRWAAQARMRIGGGVSPTVVNNTDEPVVYYDTVLGDAPFGWRLMKDGDPLWVMRDEGGETVWDLAGIDTIRVADGSEVS